MYQPIMRLETGQIVALEALLRWNRPGHGSTSPRQFLALAEERGLIVPMGLWALETACRQAQQWFQRHPGGAISLGVNLSRRQVADATLPQRVQQILHETGLDPARLSLEITERGVIDNGPVPLEVLGGLKALGVKLYLDDFGTGYSSLSCVHKCPLDGLKIDGAFMSEMTRSRDYTAVIHAIMSLARNLGLQVVAEGVESAEQVALLRSLGCEWAQGHYFSEPRTVEAIDGMLADGGRVSRAGRPDEVHHRLARANGTAPVADPRAGSARD
jgi:EAL domain-containing protein (putative c-di-GMP-specific phosphodiesterase class I)